MNPVQIYLLLTYVNNKQYSPKSKYGKGGIQNNGSVSHQDHHRTTWRKMETPYFISTGTRAIKAITIKEVDTGHQWKNVDTRIEKSYRHQFDRTQKFRGDTAQGGVSINLHRTQYNAAHCWNAKLCHQIWKWNIEPLEKTNNNDKDLR